MAYTRLLNLDEETESKLKNWLNTEILNHLQERGAWQNRLVAYNDDYWAEPVVTEKTFPFKGACSIVIPLTAIAVEAVHAYNMTTLFGMPNFINVGQRDPNYSDSAQPFEDYANYTLEQMKFKKKFENSLLCLEKFGNGIGKVMYRNEVRYGIREVGGVETQFPVTTYQGADLFPIHTSRFMMPFNAQDPQEAKWCGETHLYNPDAIRVDEDSGLYYKGTYEKLRNYYTSAPNQDQVTIAQQQNEDRVPVMPNLDLEPWEIWTDFDIDKSDTLTAIQVMYHYESNTLMAVRHNTNSDLRRPYRCGVYIPMENRWAGIGICKQNEQFQLEVTIIHRQRIDNATIANIRMFKVAKMSGYGPKEPIFPGKMWFLDDMKDIEAFQVGEIYPSSYNNEQQAVIYSQQRTGVNELTLGMPQAGTPGTATGDVSRIQESKRKSDYILGNIKEFALDLVYDIFDVNKTYGSQRVKYLATNDQNQQVQQILTLPTDAIRDALIFKLNISGQSSNQILDQQNMQQIAGFTQQYWSQLISMAQMTGNAQLTGMLMLKATAAATEVFKQILVNMNYKNIDRIIFDPAVLFGGAQNGQLPNPAGIQGAQALPPGQGIASIS